MVEMGARLATRGRNLDTGEERSSECTVAAAAWRLTEHGWRATDIRHGDRWASRGTCLRQGPQVGEIVRVRQVATNDLHQDFVLVEVSNPSDLSATVGGLCPPDPEASVPPDQAEPPHYLIDVPPGGHRILALGIRRFPASLVTRMAVCQTGLEAPAILRVPIQWHWRPYRRRGWCRHSTAPQPN